jgi:predicted GIY-YIG superfamily endonuclease
MATRATASARDKQEKKPPHLHHVVYVVFLRNPKGDGKAGYYVGMTGLTPEQRFENHKAGIKASSLVRRFGERLVPKLTEHLGPMSYADALAMEKQLFEELKARGFQVFGGH